MSVWKITGKDQKPKRHREINNFNSVLSLFYESRIDLCEQTLNDKLINEGSGIFNGSCFLTAMGRKTVGTL